MFDFVVCTYAIHHLTDEQKVHFIQALLEHVKPTGKVLIGDVAFKTREQLEQCRIHFDDSWDDDEIYPVIEGLKVQFPNLQFKSISFCSGILLFEQSF